MVHRIISIGAGLLCTISNASAQDVQSLVDLLQQSGTRSVDESQTREFEKSPRVLVLTTGRLVEGQMTQSLSGYTVKSGRGSFLVPFKMIKLTARTRHDAYLKYRKLMPAETSTNHTALAEWCIQYQLINDARIELKRAILLDSQNQKAISLLSRLDRLAIAKAKAATPISLKKESQLYAREERSIHGLSSDSVRTFNSTIQPILMNNCAKSGCHHTRAENDFKLDYVRSTGYGNRLSTERNLQAVLAQIDNDKPADSPLIENAANSHAGVGKTLVGAGAQGPKMLQRLELWVEQVAREQNPELTSASSSSSRNQTGSSSRSRIEDSLTVPDDQFVREILEKNRTDAFSPSRFNNPPR